VAKGNTERQKWKRQEEGRGVSKYAEISLVYRTFLTIQEKKRGTPFEVDKAKGSE